MPDRPVENLAPPPGGPPAGPEPLLVPTEAAGGARFEVLCVLPEGGWSQLLYWVPAMGMPARHYLPLAGALAKRGMAVAVHEWRGIGSSNRRAGRHCNWGYRQLLQDDLAAGMRAVRARWPQATCVLGGHSLGGQLATLYASLHPDDFAGLVLVASGAPYWRRFRHGWLIGMAYLVAPLLAALVGHLPGRRIGFGGNEARGVIDDWARSGRTGRYAARGMPQDLEQSLAALRIPVQALRLQEDWLGPAASLDWLLGKLGQTRPRVEVVTREDMAGLPADHFGWMKTPEAVASRMARWISEEASADGVAA